MSCNVNKFNPIFPAEGMKTSSKYFNVGVNGNQKVDYSDYFSVSKIFLAVLSKDKVNF